MWTFPYLTRKQDALLASRMSRPDFESHPCLSRTRLITIV